MGFLGENNKPNEKKIYYNNENDDLFCLQIKYTLSKISQQYANNNNNDLINSPMCDYYCNYLLNTNKNNNNNINNININKNVININEKRSKNIRHNNYYNKFSVGFKNKNCI